MDREPTNCTYVKEEESMALVVSLEAGNECMTESNIICKAKSMMDKTRVKCPWCCQELEKVMREIEEGKKKIETMGVVYNKNGRIGILSVVWEDLV